MATLIDDATATEYFNGIENAPEDKRQQMADDLLAWGNAKQEQEYNQADEHFSKLFTDQAYFEQEKASNAAVLESPDPDQAAKRTLIGAYMEHKMGRPIDTMSYQVERDAFSMSAYGQKNINDGQLFDFISGDYETQQKKTEALNDLHMQSVGKAIKDAQLGQNRPFVDGMTDVFNTWQQKYPELVDGTNDAAFLSQGYKLYYDTINDLDSVRPQAAQTLTTLEKFTKGESDPEALQTLSNTLIGATPEERQKIYKYVTLAAEAGHIDRAGLDQFALNMGQSFTRGFDFVPQGSLQMQEAGVNNWLESIRNGTQIWVPVDGDLSKAEVGNAPAGVESDAWRQATVPEAETLIQSGQNVREGFKVVRELRNVAKTGVDPIRPVLEENSFWGTAERGAYGLAGSIAPMAATAVNPFLGVIAYQANEYDRIMLENPDVNPQFAQGLALVEGAANAAIDRVQLKSLSGKLPMFGRYLDRIKSDGIRRTVKIGANVVEQNLQEGAQDLIAPVLETAVAALREDMPDKDFSSLMEGWAGQRAETFFATLPLSLIGGGVATFRDIKHPSEELNATKLRMAGFSPEQTTFIQRAENPEEYDARIQMEFPNRTPDNIKAGEELIQQSISEAQNPPENSAKLEETVAKDGTRMWTVTTPDGKELLQTKDQQAALDAIAQHGHAQILNKQFETQYEPEELRQIINDRIANWTSQDSNNTLVMESQGMNAQQKLEQLQAAGNAAQIQELHNRIANSPLKDTPYEQINILGEASVDDVAEMVFGSLITINPNTRPENLREEIHHTAVKVALKNGSVTLDTLRGWLDATEKALPGTFQNLVRDTEGDIVESLAQVQAAYEDGKIDANEASALPASFIDYIKNMMRTFAEVMRRAVALRGAFKDGALPAEYESFLADSVGLNQQSRVDTARERVASDVLTDTGATNYSIGSDMVVENGRAYSPTVRDLLQRRAAGENIPRSVIDQAISDNFPAQLVEPPKSESDLPSRATIDDAINEGQRRDQIDKSSIQPGDAVTIRQDVPAMTRKGVGIVTIKGKSGNSYDAAARISDPQFILNEKKSLEIGMGGAKGPHIAIRGKWASDQSMPSDLSEWTQVGFNPDRHSFYYDRATMKQVVGGSEAYQIGNTVFVKDAKFGDGQISDISYSIGKKQDTDYLAAVESGDMETVQRMVDEAAKASGYSGSDHRMQHSAPDRESTALASIKTSDLLPNDYWEKPQFYQSMPEEWGSFSVVKDALNRAEKYTSEGKDGGKLARITVYRSVPKSIKEESIRNGDWVTPSKEYAALEGRSIPEGYKIISQRVSLKNLWWDGNSIAELGFDDGKDYAYKNTKNNRKLIAPVTYDENGNVIPLSQRFNPRNADINYSIGIDRNAISQVSEKDDASRVGTSKLGTAKVPKNTPQESNISGDNVPDELLASQMAKVTYAHLPKAILSETNPQKKRRKLINWFKKNLLALHDAFPEGVRARATHWYDGANRIAKELGNQFQASVEQASGVIAVFSPQKDWFMNVAQAEQFIELWTNSQDVVLEESLVRAEIEGIIEAATAPAKQKRKKQKGETKEQAAERQKFNKALDERAKVDRRKKVEQVIGKTIRQLDAEPDLQGWAIRVLAQITFGRNYRNLSPEGDRLGMAANDDGALSKNGWGSINEIEKAVRIMKDGSLKNISDNLGNEHKVRNFYNNIVAPNTPYGDATIDTHAVAAAHLMPYGAKATEVGHNFGSGMNGSEVLGISGVYHLYLDAYREAAADRGILPRQMQSITWEAIRLVYPAATKNATTLAKSQKTWKDLTDDSARNTLVGGRIPSPVWAGANDNGESQSNPTGLGENIGQEGVSGGSLLSGVRPTGAGRDGGVNYSIASQSEIDRVNKALGGMNRGPDERLKVYQRAKAKFSKLMAWNSDELAAMADTGSDDSQIRRTQILQALGELDGILSVLPPEVRGRVGGYTKLAGIAPMDVLKDGVKISEVSGMKGALISAWMDQGLNIGQAGKKVDFPPGYEATENLSTKRADKSIADFFRDRIKKIDTELEKVLVREYTEAITKVVKQSRPKAGDNGVRKSTLGAETQKFADTVLRATLLDDEATAKRMAEIEAALTMPDATAEDISALSEEWSILNTFGDLDNRSSETLAQGLDWLKGQFQMGREAWRIKEQARIDEQRARNAATIEWLGKGTAKKRNATKTKSELASDLANHYLLSHANFEQFVTAIFPPEIATKWSDRLRKADEASQAAEIRDRKGILDAVRAGAKAANMSTADAMLWLKADQKNAVSYLEGRKVKDERIAIDLAQKIVTGEADRSKLTDSDVETLRNELAALPADTQKEFVTIKRVIFRGEDVKLDMSRGKAMQYLLSWNQPDVQIKMRKEGWTDDSAADLKALVNDPVSREVMDYAKELYGKGAGIVNPVYSRMFGMNMPQVKNYAPTRFINAKDTKDIGLDGSPSATGTTPGFAKSRVTHSAKIAPEDALNVMQGHIAQQAHWVHFAELAREFRAILSNPEVRESIKQTHGESVLKDAELWADQMEQRGGNKARESTWMNTILGTVLSGKAVSSLGFNLKTLAMQLDNSIRFGLALDMSQIVSALSNPSTIVEDIQTVWESEAIQNRLQGGATAEAKFLFSRYAGKPNFAAKIAEASMTPINWMDSAATSISSAIVYRANLIDALKAGMPEQLAKQTALDAASKAIYQFAQPVSFGQKSIIENNGNVMAKMFFLFMSDARLKTAVLADAARGLATGSGDKGTHIRRILAIETMAVLSHVVSSAFRDGLSDDDDEEIWNLGGFAKAILLAPLQGYFFAGTLGELAISKLTGQKTFNSTTQNPLLSAMEQGVRAGNNLEDAFDLDDPDAMFKEWNNIFRSMALSPAMAAPAVLLNMVKPVMGLYENATTED